MANMKVKIAGALFGLGTAYTIGQWSTDRKGDLADSLPGLPLDPDGKHILIPVLKLNGRTLTREEAAREVTAKNPALEAATSENGTILVYRVNRRTHDPEMEPGVTPPRVRVVDSGLSPDKFGLMVEKQTEYVASADAQQHRDAAKPFSNAAMPFWMRLLGAFTNVNNLLIGGAAAVGTALLGGQVPGLSGLAPVLAVVAFAAPALITAIGGGEAPAATPPLGTTQTNASTARQNTVDRTVELAVGIVRDRQVTPDEERRFGDVLKGMGASDEKVGQAIRDLRARATLSDGERESAAPIRSIIEQATSTVAR